MALSVNSPGSPSSTLYKTIQLSGFDDIEKRRRKRTIIATDQLSQLETLYKQEQWPNRERKEKLAKEIGMSTHFVNIWFQNKRSRMKKMAQEEEELAAIKKEGNYEPEQVQEKEKTEPKLSKAKLKVEVKPVPIAPKSPVVLAATVKTELETQQKLSPQVGLLRLNLPIQLAQSPQPQVQTMSPVSQKKSQAKQETDQQKNNIEKPLQLQVAPTISLEQKVQQVSSPKKMHPGPASPAAQQIQIQHQQTHKPKVRFATNPAVVLNKLSLPKTSVNSVKEVPTQEIPSSSATNSPAPGSNLFDCLVAMVAIEEGGIIQKDDPSYDIAVNSALYGIKVDEEVVLIHDKKKGLKFRSTASDDVP